MRPRTYHRNTARRVQRNTSNAQPFFQPAATKGEPGPEGGFFTAAPTVVQAQLSVGQPGDRYEQEADTMADRVVGMSASSVAFAPSASGGDGHGMGSSIQRATQKEDEKLQRAELKEEEKVQPVEKKEEEIQRAAKPEEKEKVQRAEMKEEDKVQRAPKPEEEEKVQRAPQEEKDKPMLQTFAPGSSGGTTVSPSTAVRINSTKGTGSPMPAPAQHEMSTAFGHDFSTVRIHTDSEAESLSDGLGAHAFTLGQDVYFNRGKFNPDTRDGKRLLAHELTHVVQQGGQKGQVQRAEIEYRPLTWSDFKGSNVGEFDAVTATSIKAPSFNKAKPVLTEVDTTEPCTLLNSRGEPQKDRKNNPKMSTSRSVDIKMNTAALVLKAVMNQNKSAAKAFFKKPTVRISECVKEVTTPCEKFFKQQAKEKLEGGTFELNGVASEIKHCKEVLQVNCIKRKQEAADNLLVHEQGHFDLTEAFARTGTAELTKMAEEIATTTVSGCGPGAGKKEAEKTLKGGLSDQIKAKIAEIKARFTAIALNTTDSKTKEVQTGELWKTQEEYDTDSDHNANTAGQVIWNHKIEEMLKP